MHNNPSVSFSFKLVGNFNFSYDFAFPQKQIPAVTPNLYKADLRHRLSKGLNSPCLIALFRALINRFPMTSVRKISFHDSLNYFYFQ